jgi:hypothetical protein
LYNTYIDKRQGLMDSGLNPKSRVRLQVMEKEHKRIFLKFTDDVKQIAIEEQRQEQEEIERQQNELRASLQQQREKNVNAAAKDIVRKVAESNVTDSREESDVRGSNADDSNDINVDDEEEEDDDEEEDEYDNYDEEREIEDSLGLGMY